MPRPGAVQTIWALLAAYLTKRPAWVQAAVFGVCTGLFVTAGAEADSGSPTWVHVAYSGAWLLSIAAAVLALFGAGGFKVAVLAIVPIVPDRIGTAADPPPKCDRPPHRLGSQWSSALKTITMPPTAATNAACTSARGTGAPEKRAAQ
jgi:hypothetical protein